MFKKSTLKILAIVRDNCLSWLKDLADHKLLDTITIEIKFLKTLDNISRKKNLDQCDFIFVDRRLIKKQKNFTALVQKAAKKVPIIVLYEDIIIEREDNIIKSKNSDSIITFTRCLDYEQTDTNNLIILLEKLLLKKSVDDYEKMFNILLDKSSDVIIITDDETNEIIYNEDSFKRILGKTSYKIKDICSQANTAEDEVEIYDDDKNVLKLNVYPFDSKDSNVVKKLILLRTGLFEDHEKREKAQIAEFSKHLLQMSQELRTKTQEMEEFVYTISHDLKAPMISIIGYINLLNEEIKNYPSEDVAFYLERIEKNIEMMEQTISDILEYSRIGRITEKKDYHPLEEIINDVIKSFLPKINEKDIEVVIDPNLPNIYAEKKRMVQLFENLIDNSIKYMKPDPKAERKITIGVKEIDDDFVTLYVKDTGIGIKKEFHSKLFRLFSRIPNELIEDVSGSGIGLANVKKIVETHGGSIWVESDEGEGATFYFKLPLKQRYI